MHRKCKWHCGHHDHASIDAEQNTMTSDNNLSIEQCIRAREEGKVQIQDHMVQFKKGQKSFNPTLVGRKAKKLETIVLDGLG